MDTIELVVITFGLMALSFGAVGVFAHTTGRSRVAFAFAGPSLPTVSMPKLPARRRAAHDDAPEDEWIDNEARIAGFSSTPFQPRVVSPAQFVAKSPAGHRAPREEAPAFDEAPVLPGYDDDDDLIEPPYPAATAPRSGLFAAYQPISDIEDAAPVAAAVAIRAVEYAPVVAIAPVVAVEPEADPDEPDDDLKSLFAELKVEFSTPKALRDKTTRVSIQDLLAEAREVRRLIAVR